MTLPEIGQNVPDFTAPTDDGSELTLSALRGNIVVLYFYPRAGTPSCTKEACSFRDNIQEFNNKDAVILGVSPDSVKSHQSFIQKQNLKFTLLSDSEHQVAEAYGA